MKVRAGGERIVAVGEGNGPVNALDQALRTALGKAYPELTKLELIDYRVRIVDAAHGTDAVTRVLVETSDGETSWETVGVHANIIEASWEALVEAVTFGLLRAPALTACFVATRRDGRPADSLTRTIAHSSLVPSEVEKLAWRHLDPVASGSTDRGPSWRDRVESHSGLRAGPTTAGRGGYSGCSEGKRRTRRRTTSRGYGVPRQ